MIRKMLILTSAAAMMLLISPVSLPAAQLTLAQIDAQPASQVFIPITVASFTSVAGLELHIEYDTTKLETPALSDETWLASATINLGDDHKRIHIIWENFLAPMNLNDGDTLLVLSLEAKFGALGTAFVNFLDNSELVDEFGNPLSLTLNDGIVSFQPTDADDNDALPISFELKQNQPNPFNPATTIIYTVDRRSRLTFTVFNPLGQQVERIDLGYKNPGEYQLIYQPVGLASGVYTYQISDGVRAKSRQMVLLK